MKGTVRNIFLPILGVLAVASSCIKNDLPYPKIVPSFKTINVPDAESVNIDVANMTVDVFLPESADIARTRISGVTFEHEKTQCTPDINGVFDLSSPLEFTLSIYQQYEWKIVAHQNIERYFSVAGQIGASVIDEKNHRVVAYVSDLINLTDLKVLSYKLGPKDISVYSVMGHPQGKELLDITDFSDVVSLNVIAHGRTEIWNIYIEQKEASVSFSKFDAWTRVAYVAADGIAGLNNGFKYKKKIDSQWIEVPQSQVSHDGGSFSAAIDGLQPLTAYECIAYSGDIEVEAEFITEDEVQLPNPGFEVYSLDPSGRFNNWFDKAHSLWNTKWWDSGNVASTTVGEAGVICSPDLVEKVEGDVAARLNSRYVVIKFAAGNLFSGEFAELVGTSGGIVNFGRPFTNRPRKLSFMMKYQCGQVDYVNGYPSGAPVAVGDQDRCQIFIALGDWDYHKYGGTKTSPVSVNTTKTETFFNPKSEAVIAYGTIIRNTSCDWTRVEIPLDYVSTSRIPTHIIISCASSMLGDYFTGSSSSTLWLDDMKLEY